MHPWVALLNLLKRLNAEGLPYFLLGDLNARTASDTPSSFHPVRVSEDQKTNTRGNNWLNELRRLDCSILNGSQGIPGAHCGFTSFQYVEGRTPRRAVVDYAVCPNLCLPFITRFDVEGRTIWSDHAPIILQVLLPRTTTPLHGPKDRRRIKHPPLPIVTHLDHLLDRILSAETDPRVAMGKAYGWACPADKAATTVYTDGSCMDANTHRASAGAGVFFGNKSAKNTSHRVPGEQTNNRGELYAILAALLGVSCNRL